MRIKQLSKVVANQIAAGEVIERPASVVKELLENCLDAQASQINIDIGYGGLNQIKVIDNGAGIVAEDLPLAIAAHATSKIAKLNDLYSIASMGFRGEALASIASISRLSISSKPPTQAQAMCLSAEGGAVVDLVPCARNTGTTIDVRDIFFNAPVRKKFLKSQRSEFLAIDIIVRRFALSAPNMALRLTHNDKQLLNLPAAGCDKSRLARVRKLLGKMFIDESHYLDIEHAGLRLQGWISTPQYQRSQNDKMWLYVNGRMVKDKLLNHAIKQAYEGLLYPGRHPSCLLYLTINPAEVDVNVHPTKHELRFQQPRLIHDFISSQIQRALHPQIMPDFPGLVPEVLEVRETFSTALVKQKTTSAVKSNHSWVSLHDTFALIYLQEQPYLVDLPSLQRKWLLETLVHQPLPLSKRPLLVPINHTISRAMHEKLSLYCERLQQVGIELDLAGENTVLIRSLPLLVPHLNLNQFLIAVFNDSVPFINELFKLLIEHQTFDLKQTTQAEMAELIDYLHTLSDEQLKQGCLHLSWERCKDLLNA